MNKKNVLYNELELKLLSLCTNGQIEQLEKLFKEKIIIQKEILNKCLIDTCKKYNYIGDFQNVILLLLSKGGDINYREKTKGYTSLIIATINGHAPLVKLLLNNKADINAVDKFGESAIFHTIKKDENEFFQILTILLENDANVTILNSDKQIPLSLAIENRMDKFIPQLIKKMTDFKFRDASGNSLLHLASKFNNEYLVKFLLKKGGIKNDNNFNFDKKIPSELTNSPNIIVSFENSKPAKKKSNNLKKKLKKKNKNNKKKHKISYETVNNQKTNNYIKTCPINIKRTKSLSLEEPILISNLKKIGQKSENQELFSENDNIQIISIKSHNTSKEDLEELESLKKRKELLRQRYEEELKKHQQLLERLKGRDFEDELKNDFEKLEELQNIENDETTSFEFNNENNHKLKFESNILINSLQSSDEESNQINDDYCENCIKMFNIKVNYTNSNLEKLLHEEIVEFVKEVDLITENKQKTFKEIIISLREIISSAVKSGFELYTYGSYANGLNLPWSDIDLLIEFTDNSDGKENLELIEKAFKKSEKFLEANYIKSASIPVLKLFTDVSFGSTKIDITIKDSNHFGLNCVALIKKYLVIYKPLKPVTLVLKQLLYKTELNDPYKGGLSSYGLILMVVSFLQSLILKDLYSKIENNFGKILIEFLRFYTNFDYLNNQIVASYYHEEVLNPFPYVN